MNYALVLLVVNLAARIGFSQQDCRVLADCENGTPRWKDLTSSGTVGIPGKRGRQGLQGQKGEPGLGVNISEVKEQLQAGENKPRLYHYTGTITWDSGKSFCETVNRKLCSFDQICFPKAGGRQLIGDVIPGNHWVPVLDDHNEWVEIGHYHGAPCFFHSIWSKPSWGTQATFQPYKGYVYCCKIDASVESTLPSMKYQYIGQSATYASSENHCESQGRRLCYSSEICSKSKPKFGVVQTDQWAAIKDRPNDWIQIGNAGRLCGLHGLQSGLPAWGTRTDGSLHSFVGYVLCCAK